MVNSEYCWMTLQELQLWICYIKNFKMLKITYRSLRKRHHRLILTPFIKWKISLNQTKKRNLALPKEISLKLKLQVQARIYKLQILIPLTYILRDLISRGIINSLLIFILKFHQQPLNKVVLFNLRVVVFWFSKLFSIINSNPSS